MPSLIADRRHSLFGHISRLLENTPASQALQLSIEAHTGTPPAADWKRPPRHPRRNWLQQVEEDIGLSVGAALYGHFGPRTLRPQDTSAPIFGAEVSQTLRHRCPPVPKCLSAPVLKCLKTLREGAAGQQQTNRTYRHVHADPRVQDLVQLLCHITPVAQHSSVDVTSGTVAGRLACVVAPGLWLRDARRSTRQPDQQTSV